MAPPLHARLNPLPKESAEVPFVDPVYASQPPQRVPVSVSMMYAYAAMRGNTDRAENKSDPLHESLYLNSIKFRRPEYEQPVNLHAKHFPYDRNLGPELPPGAIHFHDLQAPMYPGSPPPQTPHEHGDMVEKTSNLGRYVPKNPPKSPPNYYKGQDGYGNYGYLEVNGRWVDPDGEIDILNAIQNRGPCTPPGLCVGTKPIPFESEEEVYQGFLAEVNDPYVGSDGEGDPRAFHITPEIFARWAAGASKGDGYTSIKVPPQDPPLRSYSSRHKIVPALATMPLIQFDDAGSIISGEYSPESNPSICMSHRGVNMTWLPSYFAYSYPQVAIDHERIEYAGVDPNELSNERSKERVATWLNAPTESPLPVTEENAIKYLADPEDPSAVHEYLRQHRVEMEDLYKEHLQLNLGTAAKGAFQSKIVQEAERLFIEGSMMEHALNKRDREQGSPFVIRSIARNIGRPAPSSIMPLPVFLTATATTPTPRSRKLLRKTGPFTDVDDLRVQTQTLRRKKQFERYFRERTEHSLIQVNKLRRADADIDFMMDELGGHIEALKLVHQSYRRSLGVEDVSEIPNLMPMSRRRVQ